jgi:hypothetical protein
MRTNDASIAHSQPGVTTKVLAGVCHNCGICPFAARKPDSKFAGVMRWHRTWCPAWNAHTKVYGEKPLA